MNVDGNCLCGHVQYAAEVDPKKVLLCHCSDCQVSSGGPMSWMAFVVDGSFQLQSGALKTFTKTAESGRRRVISFCPECGTRILSEPEQGVPGPVSLRVGTVRQRTELRPRVHLWSRSSQAWLDSLQTLPKVETQP